MKNLPISIILLKVLSLLPILLWPLIFYGSIFIFDDPNFKQLYKYLMFFGINAYPIYLCLNYRLATRLFENYTALSVGLFLWPYNFHYEELPNRQFIFSGSSTNGDSIWIRTRSKSLKDYPLTSNRIRWVTDLE